MLSATASAGRRKVQVKVFTTNDAAEIADEIEPLPPGWNRCVRSRGSVAASGWKAEMSKGLVALDRLAAFAMGLLLVAGGAAALGWWYDLIVGAPARIRLPQLPRLAA